MIEILLCVVTILFGLFTVSTLPTLLLGRFEKSCYDTIEKRDKEIEDKKEINKTIKKLLF